MSTILKTFPGPTLIESFVDFFPSYFQLVASTKEEPTKDSTKVPGVMAWSAFWRNLRGEIPL